MGYIRLMDNLPCIPVPRRAMTNGWSPARQWQFLQRLEDGASVAVAARRVGMSEASAYRLRRHPEAEDFRRAWDAAQARVWQRVEQVALDRVVNGDIETIERDGMIVATRRRPCSDRLMIHMLKEQLRRSEAQAAALAAANAAMAAEARRAEWPIMDGKRVAPLVPAPIDAAAAETSALRESHDRAERLPDSTDWDAPEVMANSLDGPAPRLPMPERTLAPADGLLVIRTKRAQVKATAVKGEREVRKTPPGADFSRPDDDDPERFLDRFSPHKAAIVPCSNPASNPARVRGWN